MTDFFTPEAKMVVGAGVNADSVSPKKTPFESDLSGTGSRKEREKVALWLDRINVARRHRDMMYEKMGVNRFLEEYQGEYRVTMGRMAVPPVNEVYAYAQSLLSLLMNRNPHIAVNPEKEGTILGARIWEKAVNYLWRELDIKEEIEDELIDVVLAGSAWHKTGMTGSSAGQTDKLRILRDKMYSLRVSPWDIVWNIGSKKVPKDCQWIAHRIVRRTEDIKDTYGDRAAGLKGGAHPTLDKDAKSRMVFKDDLNFSSMWEVWDKANMEFFLLAENHGRYLKVPSPWPKHLEDWPFSHLYFNRIPDEPFPMPDIAPFEPQILEKIKMIAMGLNHVKRWNRQLFIKRGSLRRTEMDKFERGNDGTIIEVDGGNSLSEIMKPTDYPALQGDVYALLVRLDDIIRTVSGQPASSQGGSDRAPTRTLGELELISQGGQNRVARKIDRVETHVERIARQMIAHLKKNFNPNEIVKMTGFSLEQIQKSFPQNFDPVTGQFTFSKDDIAGEYDVKVQSGSTLPLNKQNRLTILNQVLEQASKIASVQSLPPFMETIITEILRDLDIKTLERSFREQAEKAKAQEQAQNQERQAEMQKSIADADKRRAQAGQIRSQTATEGARALKEAADGNFLPEAIEFGRGTGVLPSDGDA